MIGLSNAKGQKEYNIKLCERAVNCNMLLTVVKGEMVCVDIGSSKVKTHAQGTVRQK